MDTRLSYQKEVGIRLSKASEIEGSFFAYPETDRESELIAGLRSGDSQKTKKIFDIYFNRLYTFVFHEVDYNGPAAEDIVQETFIGAFQSAKKFKGNCQIYTWLVNIARHKIADYYRKMKHEIKNRSLDNQASSLEQLMENGAASINFVESTEDRLIVEQALRDLPPDYRQTLVLKYVQEMPVAEISRVMKRSPKSIEGLLTRAKKALRDSVENRARDSGR
jgi:RNA polymerase sigma-70 factor (ECF subfamily)